MVDVIQTNGGIFRKTETSRGRRAGDGGGHHAEEAAAKK